MQLNRHIFIIFIIISTETITFEVQHRNSRVITIPAYRRPARSFVEIDNKFKLKPYENVLKYSSLTEIDQLHEFAPKEVKNHIATFHENTPHKILLIGPTGTGKSCLANLIVLRCCLPYIKISGAELGDEYEESEKLYIDTLFKVLTNHHSRTALIVDELTALTSKLRGIDEQVESVYYFFQKLAKCNQKVVLITTTRELEEVPKYFVNKFRSIYHIDYPSESFRLSILQTKFGLNPKFRDVLRAIAVKTAGFSLRELDHIFRDAQDIANYREQENPKNADITLEDIQKAIKRAMKVHKKLHKLSGTDLHVSSNSWCTIL